MTTPLTKLEILKGELKFSPTAVAIIKEVEEELARLREEVDRHHHDACIQELQDAVMEAETRANDRGAELAAFRKDYHRYGNQRVRDLEAELARLLEHNEELGTTILRLREEIEQWRKEAQFKEDERVRLREALERIVAYPPNNSGRELFQRATDIARNALKETK